jgi:NADH dehydrogenase
VGDCALVPDLDNLGQFHPPTAQHAIRQAKVVAHNVAAAVLDNGRAAQPFRFKTLGQLAAIGRRAGVAKVMGLKFSGFPAWFLWRSIYLMKLPRFEKKIRVAFDWTLDLFFAKDLVQYLPARETTVPMADPIPERTGPKAVAVAA